MVGRAPHFWGSGALSTSLENPREVIILWPALERHEEEEEEEEEEEDGSG